MDDDGGNEFFDVADNMSTLLTSQSPLAALAQPPPPPDAPMQAPEARAGPGPNRSSASRDRANIWDSLPGANASLEQRFDFLFDWVQHAGFGSLDHLLEVWYTGDFDVSSPLRQEQRLSRHRGLTTLLAKLRGSTHWSKWERWGYQEETLQGAESILRAEFSALISAQCAQFGRLVAAFDARSDRDKHEATRALKRCLQDEVSLTIAQRCHGKVAIGPIRRLIRRIRPAFAAATASHVTHGGHRRLGQGRTPCEPQSHRCRNHGPVHGGTRLGR